MDKDELIAILEKLPKGTEVYVRSDDNAWPARPRLFNNILGVSPFKVFIDLKQGGNHLNFPEHYSGAVEYDIQTHKELNRW